MAKQTEPRKVTSIPEGYNKEIRDGKTVYVKKSESSSPNAVVTTTKVKPKVKVPTSNKGVNNVSIKRKVSTTPTVPSRNLMEDVVYLDEPLIATPNVSNIPLFEDKRIDRKLQAPINPNFDYYKYPDANAGYSQATDKFVDRATGKFIDAAKSMSTGTYVPSYLDEGLINDPINLGTEKQGNPRVTTTPLVTDVMEGVGRERSGTKGASTMGTVGFKKGGIVSKIKGYANAGVVTENPYLSGNPNMQGQGTQFTNSGNAKGSDNFYSAFGADQGATSGVVGQTDVYGKAKLDETKKTNNENSAKLAQSLGGVAMGIGNSLYKKPTDIYANQNQQATEDSLNSVVDSTAQSIPVVGSWYGAAMGANKTGRSMLAKDKYGDVKQGGNAAADELFESSHEHALDAASKGDAAGTVREITGVGKVGRALTNLFGKQNETTGTWGDINKAFGTTEKNDAKNKPFTQQLGEINAANIKDKRAQALAARDAGNFNAKITTKYNVGNNPQYDENKRLLYNDGQVYMGEEDNGMSYKKGGIVSKIQMCANGGKIVGKGTGKSDSILAKVEADSFIVPAENAKAAEKLREKFLGKPPKQKANLNDKNGELVKLSNGEHKFTPEEKEELLEKGVNVDLLAPKSEVKAVEKKSHIMFPNVIGLKEGGNVPKGTKVDGVTWNGTNWIDSSGNKYTAEKGKVFENKYNQSVNKAKSNEESRKASELNVYKRKYNEAVNAGDIKQAEGLNRKIKELQGVNKITPNEVKSESDSSVIVPKKANIKAPKVTVDNLPTKDVALTELKKDAELRTNAAAIDQENSIANAPTKQAVINDTMSTNGGYTNPTRRGGILDRISNIDPTSLVGIGQTALGYNMLKDSKRPVDKAIIDPTYNSAVNRSQQDALFGLTPEQRFAAEQDIQNGLNDAKAVGLNYSGGNGVQAFNTNRTAINDAWRNKLGLKQADTDLRMQKQKYADAMAADRANILSANRRQAYNDAMGTFQQNQQAGSELVGAGLQNTIGAYRYNKIKNQEDEINRASNPWLNYKA